MSICDIRAGLRAPSAIVAGVALALAGSSAAHAARPVAGSVTPERLKLPSGPSSVRGLADEPAVDPFYAQINYAVPIELPGGFGGLSPALALSYSGALGNGPMGIGWTLSQVKIQRSTRFGVPHFDDTDELELSGARPGRLIAIGGGEYRVEGMGQTVRVRKVGAGFELDDGKGVHYRLGASPAARQESDASHTLAWLVETQTNLMGEQIQYQYSRDQGQVYLTQITWGPGGAYGAQLIYEPRSDATRSYRGGFAVVTAQRLATVKVIAFGSERRAYHLAYDATFPVARLSGVTSTGVAGNGAWPALAFRYAAPSAPVIAPITGIGAWRLNSSGTTLVDLDGDGAAELLQVFEGGHSYLANQNGVFGAAQTLTGNTLSITASQLQDLDGDARAELVQDTGAGWSVWKFTRTQWVKQTGIWPGTPGLPLKDPTLARFADLNGDGLVDAMQWDNDNLKVRLATRTGFPAVATSLPRIGGAVLPTAQGRFQDANGDGLDDYLVVAADRIDLYVGRGNGTFDPAVAVAYPFTGTVSDPDDIELGDLDRDGLIDLIKVDLGTVRWYRGLATGGFTATAVTLANPESRTTTVVVALADTNGNGSQDVVWSSASGMWRMDLAGATTAGMLVHVDNGLGMAVDFDYRSSHALSVEARQAADPWAVELPMAMPVPVTKTTALGPGETTRKISYGVRDGFWDAVEQRFGGFRTTTVTTAGATAAETTTVITRYNAGTGANRVLRGKPLVEQVKDGTGKRLSMTTSTWEAMVIAGLPDVPLLRRAVLREVRGRHEDIAPVRETDITYDHDALGRQRHSVDSGRLDLTGDESVKDTTYADDDTTWVRDRLCEDKVSDAGGTVVSDVQHIFGDDQTELALCAVGKGWPRRTLAWLAGESRWITQTQTRYDAHGNPISLIKDGVERRIAYDATGLFPIEERMAAPARDLVWQATWDTVLGALVAVTDPSGHTAHTSYDALGRFIGVASDDRPQHQIIEYDWTAPFPKTTVWQFDGALADVAARPAVWSPTARWRQTVEVANGKGEVRYRAVRIATDRWIISDYKERDPNSRVVFAGRPVFASALELSARPAGITGDQITYDPLGRVIAQRLPTGATRTYSYVAFERTMQDADLAPVRSVLDGQGRAILTERSLPDGTHEIVQASYDATGRLTRMTLDGGAVVRDFTYDTLGRLTQSRDPDLGTRTLAWDDGSRLTQEVNATGQAIHYSYDALGRLVTRDAGSMFAYHYDDARPGAPVAANLSGRLAWLEEPTGGADYSYDELGRVAVSRHRIDALVSELTTSYAASGLALGRSYDDGFALAYSYDPAGRLVQVGDLWQLLDQDAGSHALHERAGNGVDTLYTRDAIGLASEVNVTDAAGAAIYHVSATRNAWAAITAIADLDGAGLDHTAQFAYDGFSRLTSASIGSAAAAFNFGYAYDVLHNMTSRTATGPHALGEFLGAYRYAEAGRGPRQLTSIAGAAGAPNHSFNYDAAGRQIAEDGLTLSYDATDRLVRVDGLAGGPVTHAYGQDGARVKTVAPGGAASYFFGDGTAIQGGVRVHDVAVEDRVVARVALPPAVPGAAVIATGAAIDRGLGLGARGFGLAALALAALCLHRGTRRRVRAAAMLGLALATACAPPGTGVQRSGLAAAAQATFLHTGFSAGPTVFTDAAGHFLEERRYEPFGAPIDARIHTAAGDTVGSPDVVARDLNALNKRTEAATGWSDHSARWMAPETGRWLTPDPPVEGPSDKFMAAPWALHPYQYVHQNPVAYWDPDGQQPAATGTPETVYDLTRWAVGWGKIVVGNGIKVNGSAADVREWHEMMLQTGTDSPTARRLIADIGDDKDASHTITVNLGRKQPGVLVDSFASNAVDLDDLGHFPAAASAAHPKEMTRGDLIVHFIAERRAALLSAKPSDFSPAHAVGITATDNARADRGQPGVTAATAAPTASGGLIGTHTLSDGSHQDTEFNANGDVINMVKP